MIAEAREEGILIRPAVAVPAAEYQRQILDRITADYAALREDPGAWQQELKERQALEGTLLDGLDLNEMWSEDGDVIHPPTLGCMK